jgi:phage recombination protein Bet
VTDVELHRGNGVAVVLDDERRTLLKDQLNPDLSDGELALFAEVCQRVNLDPFARQIYAVKRWNNQLKRKVMTVQTSIDGFRLVAQRTGEYAGQRGPFWCGSDGEWLADPKGNPRAWLADEPPAAAMVGTLRRGFAEPLWSIARFNAYAQRNKDGALTQMWSFPAGLGDLMIGKCAEALSLRRAFPQELSGLYTAEEMAQADSAPPSTTPTLPAPADESPYVSETNAERLREQCVELGLDVAQVVTIATDGRTDDPAQVLKAEIGKVRDARDRVAAIPTADIADEDVADAEVVYEPGEEPM